MTSLPPEISQRVLEYLSPCDLARMAQVSKPWKRVIYSNSCWKLHKYWDYADDLRTRVSDAFYSGLDIPYGTRHIGEPTNVCFHDWLSLIMNKHDIGVHIPRHICECDDPVQKVKLYKKLWYHLKCPCIHTTHHKWYDVFKERGELIKLSPPDQQRVFYRYCRLVTDKPETITTNPYVYWLTNHTKHSLHYNYSAYQTLPSAPSSDHPADILAYKRLVRSVKQIQYIATERKKVMDTFLACAKALSIHGKSEFTTKDLPWDACILSCST
jgi:hypothetical protein